MGIRNVEMLDEARTHAAVASSLFYGAMLDRNGGLSPANYTLGPRRRAARKAG